MVGTVNPLNKAPDTNAFLLLAVAVMVIVSPTAIVSPKMVMRLPAL